MPTSLNAAPISQAVQRHAGWVRHVLRTGGVGLTDAEDLMQEVLLIFCRRFDDIAPPAQRSFLRETARRVASDHRKLKWNSAVFSAIDTELVDDTCPTPALALERRQLEELTGDALSAVPSAEQRVFLLSHMEHLPRRAIAEKLGIPAGTVASRLRRANNIFTDTLARLSQPRQSLMTWPPGLTPPWAAPGRGLNRAQAVGTELCWGQHRVLNNQFGYARAEGAHDQCLLIGESSSEQRLGWTWNWPGYHALAFSLPAILVGWKPWAGGASTDARYPVALSILQQLTVNYDIEVHADGSHELMLNLWLLRRQPSGEWADPSLISSEIMIDLDYSGSIPRGQLAERLRLGGHDYDLWLGSESQGRSEPWSVITLTRCQPSAYGSVDLVALFSILVQRGYLAADEWLGSIECGTAVYGGQGTAWVRQFEARLALV